MSSEEYLSVKDREKSEEAKSFLRLTPFAVQHIIYEVLARHMLTNDPADLGYAFRSRYSKDYTKSDIHLAMSMDEQTKVTNKYPAAFIYREDVQKQSPVMNQTIGLNSRESEKLKFYINHMNCGVAVIASTVGFVEDFAHYCSLPFSQNEEQIRNDFRLRRFRLGSMSRPQVFKQAKDQFVVVLSVETVFDDNILIKRDDLKVNHTSIEIYDTLKTAPPLYAQ